MKVYHGTNNKRAIEKEGFRGSKLHSTDLNENTKAGEYDSDGVVFVADCYELAAEYGDVIEMDAPDNTVHFFRECPVTGMNEFFICMSDMEEVAF
jgi:hypothetical protein